MRARGLVGRSFQLYPQLLRQFSTTPSRLNRISPPSMEGEKRCLLRLGSQTTLSGLWNIQNYDKGYGHGRALNLCISHDTPNSNHANDLVVEIHESELKQGPWSVVAKNSASQNSADDTNSRVFLTFILPSINGFAIRSDIVERRLEGYAHAHHVTTCLQPLQKITSAPISPIVATPPLVDLISSAVAVIHLKSVPGQTVAEIFAQISAELENRLSLPWISSTPIPRKRLAFVEGRGSIHNSRRIYEAAAALGIDVILIDNPGHWLQDDNGPYTYLRKEFIPTNIAVDENFTSRLVDAIQKLKEPVDGIMTISDARLTGVAEACEILGFPTEPSASHKIAANKGKTRELEPNGEGAFFVRDAEELRQKLAREGLPTGLSYPLIVKPCMGWGSEGVTKVSNEAELLAAADKASRQHANSPQKRTDFLVERYVQGPEVDANCVLQNGKIVFFEFIDDFPCIADRPGATAADHFMETMMVSPSMLSQQEHDMARQWVQDSVTRLGFSNGIFHCEGRIENSTMQYVVGEDGLEDLVPGDNTPEKAPSLYMHEINARPPGYLSTAPTAMTWGVDYYAIQQLYAVGDTERFSSLSHQFQQGAQWHLALTMMPQDEGKLGIMKTPDAVELLMDTHKDLKEAIVHHETILKGGDRLIGNLGSTLAWVAYMSVISRKSRKDCLRLAHRALQEFTYEVE